MTQIKSIVIPNDSTHYDKLNDITPASMSFSKQVGKAVEHFVNSETKVIDEYLTDKRPDYLAPIDDWKDYLKRHPEHVGAMIRRHVQLGNILRQESYAIQ
jgi:hypothetical protein